MSPHGTVARYHWGCHCLQCGRAASQYASRDAFAARMRQRNLTQGTGCTARKRAIEKRLGITAALPVTIPATTAIDASDRLIHEIREMEA